MTVSQFINLYYNLLPFFLMQATGVGFVSGFYIQNNKRVTPMNKFVNIIGYTSIGIISGIIYPISYPFFGLYVLYKKE